jgi:predicted dehydrogenase
MGLGIASDVFAADATSSDAKRETNSEKPATPTAHVDPFVVGVIGVGNRGQTVASGFAASPGVRVKYLCDVDDATLVKAQNAVAKRVAATTQPSASKKKTNAQDDAEKSESKPTTPAAAPISVKDFRRILEDKEVHGVVVVTPDHWHAPAAILAIKAGKHVYVEKPCSHNPREGELLVESARKYNRVVQHGSQRRSWEGVIKAIKAVRGGEIGNVHLAKGWYATDRKTIGRGKGVPVPPNLDYTMWQGPAPERPYRDNILPYLWHWYWNWGTGELGNNGVHFLDMCRWGLGVDFPKRVTSAGGRYFFSDDQETPDTQIATWEFGDNKIVQWEHRSCQLHGVDDLKSGASFHGDKGTILITGNGYKQFDAKDKLVDSFESKQPNDPAHIANFVQCARMGTRPNADIEDGHKSTLLCHLGNIAWRTGRTLNIDPKNGHILNDGDAEMRFWSREYRAEWEPKV